MSRRERLNHIGKILSTGVLFVRPVAVTGRIPAAVYPRDMRGRGDRRREAEKGDEPADSTQRCVLRGAEAKRKLTAESEKNISPFINFHSVFPVLYG